MKVLFVFAHPAPYKIDLFNELAKQIDLTVVFERYKTNYRHRFFYDRTNYSFRTIFLKGIAFGDENHFSLELISHIKKQPYDLIIMNGYSSMTELITIKYLIRKKIAYVLYVNGGVIKKDPRWRDKLKRTLISHAKAYFSPADKVDQYLAHYGADLSKIIRYPYATIYENQLATQKVSQQKIDEFIDKLNLPKGHIFITAGQFIDRKNNMKLLNIWLDRPKDNILLIIGFGPEEKKYHHFIETHQLDNVFILPYLRRDQLLQTIKVAKAFITLSKEDIYGHVVNESLSQGVPVISSNHVISATNLLKNGFNGYLVTLDNDPQIHQAIDEVINVDMFENCLKTSLNNTFELMAANHIEAFGKLVK